MKPLADGLEFPEGPVVFPNGDVGIVEMRAGRITRIDPKGNKKILSQIGGGPNGMALGPGGKLYVCNNGGVKWLHRNGEAIALGHEEPEYTGGRIEVVDPESGKVERLYDQCDGRPLGAPNDLVFDAEGNFWFTDSGRSRRWEKGYGALYWAKGDGSQIRRVVHPLDRPNGVGLSPDGRRVYVADTYSGRLWAWDISGPGEVTRSEPPNVHGAWLIGGTADLSRFDSLKVTASGNICIATLVKGGITEYSPDGRSMRHYPVEDAHTTNLAFGGPDMRTAYVTCSGHGWLLKMRWHEPGLRLNFN